MKEPQQEGIVAKINDVLAMRITMLVGSIWAFYAFVIFGLTPILWPEYETQILYWSNLKSVNGSHRAALAEISEGIRELLDRSRAVTDAPASTDDGALKG